MTRRFAPRRAVSYAAVGSAQFVAAGLALATTRYDGGLAYIWVANAIDAAFLVLLPRRRWPGALVMTSLVSMLATGLFGLGWRAALPMALVNLAELVIAAGLIQRVERGDDPLRSLGWLARFVLAVGVVAPAVSGVGAAIVSHLVTGHAVGDSWLQWYTGHALGAITFTPIALLMMNGSVGRWWRSATRRNLAEVTAMLGLVAFTAALVFEQHRFPLLFLPMLPLFLATFRGGRIAAALAIVVLALVGGWATAHGFGPIHLVAADAGTRMQFLQFYLAATVLTVLPVAADLAHRSRLFRRVRESEARYRLLADHSTDIIMNLDVDGRIRFVSPSIRQIGGHDPAALIGRLCGELIYEDDRDGAREAHLAALRAHGSTVSMEFRAATATGELRWFETLTRAVIGDDDRVDGVVSVTRDISARKALERRLEEQASTDPLTGAANRRALMTAIEAALGDTREGAPGGCLAIFDLDHFKRVNDRHGHDGGDVVLRSFVSTARALVRAGDLVARMGGEEFAVLLPGASLDQAAIVCDRVREQFGAMPIAFRGAALRASASAGVAPYGPTTTCAALIHAADTALYAAKAGGRDRLVTTAAA